MKKSGSSGVAFESRAKQGLRGVRLPPPDSLGEHVSISDEKRKQSTTTDHGECLEYAFHPPDLSVGELEALSRKFIRRKGLTHHLLHPTPEDVRTDRLVENE